MQRPTRPLPLLWLAGMLLLSLLLAACALDGTGAPPPGATPSPTAPSSASRGLLTYRGDGYTIGYPATWQVEPTGSSVKFSDAADNASVSIQVVPDPEGVTAPSEIVSTSMDTIGKSGLYQHYKKLPVAPVITIGGVAWQQQAARGDLVVAGQRLSMETLMMATNYPAHSAQTKLFSIYIAAPSASYKRLNMASFQPMLQSFTFVS
jgi:hypothetical protein